MSDKERQEQLSELMRTNYMIEGALNFKDCETVSCVVEAGSKLLLDNFEICVEDSYIEEIISQMCYESHTRNQTNTLNWPEDARDYKEKSLLADVLEVLEKLGDENTYRINEASELMATSISNLSEAIKANLSK